MFLNRTGLLICSSNSPGLHVLSNHDWRCDSEGDYVDVDTSGLKVVSLWDMIPKYANVLAVFQGMLGRLERLGVTGIREGAADTPESIIGDILPEVENQCDGLELKFTQARLDRLKTFLKTGAKHPSARQDFFGELKALKEALEDDLKLRVIFFPSQEQVNYYHHGDQKLFGNAVYDIFESARNDIKEAGNCYATDNFTACVFHLIRVAERGMRALAKHLKIKKVGKTALEFCDWGSVASALKAKVNRLQQRTGRTAHKAMLLQRYANAASQADYLNEIWRKDLAHTRRDTPYNQPEAMNVLLRVHEFMQTLAEWIPARQVKKP